MLYRYKFSLKYEAGLNLNPRHLEKKLPPKSPALPIFVNMCDLFMKMLYFYSEHIYMMSYKEQ